MNKDVKLFLMIFLILGAGFLSAKLNITGQTHLAAPVEEKQLIEIRVNSDPSGAEVLLSGTFAGKTPITLTLPSAQDHEIELRKTGYYTLKEITKIKSNPYNELNLVLTRVGGGNLEIRSNVNTAEVYINNNLLGITPKKLSLEEGIYDVRVRKSGYSDFFTSKLIKAGQNEELFANLKLKDVGLLFVESKPHGRIFVNDKYQGESPSLLSLPIGTQEIRIEKDGYDTKKYSVNIEKEQREDLLVKLDLSLGALLVTSEPIGSKIYIDGQYKGLTPKIITDLTDGPHTLKLTKEFYKDRLGTVSVKRNYPNSALWKLERI